MNLPAAPNVLATLALLAGAVAAMPAAAESDADAEFLAFLEYLGSWEESDAEWEELIEAELESEVQLRAPHEPGDDPEDEDVVS